MKNLLSATLPALALLALGGCASTGALTTSTETDGVYYSSKDRTTAVGSPAGVYSGNGTYGSNSGTIPARALDDTAPAPVATTDDANPDYQGGTTTQAATGSDYYSNSYSSYNTGGFGQPYTGPGVSSFNYTPSVNYTMSPSYYGSPYGYASAFGYGYSPFSYGYGGMSGFGYPYGGFYDPFYSPFGYGYGSGLSIGFGYGFSRFGGFGYPSYGFGGFGSPYGYGYGGSYYDSYGGYGRPVIYANGGRSGAAANPVLVGPRGGRGGSVMNGVAPTSAPATSLDGGGGRRNVGTYSTGGLVAPSPSYSGGGGTVLPTRRDGGGGGNVVGQPTYSNPGTTAGQPNVNSLPPQAQSSGRRGFFGGFFGSGATTGAQPNAGSAGTTNPDQPATQQRRSYSQPQYSNNAGSYSQPQYSQPQPRREYSQPSYSQPSQGGSFGGGGGGSFGGGSGGGGRRGGH